MDEMTFTPKAIAAIVAADEAIVGAEKKAFGSIVAKYCKLGTAVRELPGALADDGSMVRGFQAKVLESSPKLAQSRMSRACTIAFHGKEGYDAYVATCAEEGKVETMSGLMDFLARVDDDGTPPPAEKPAVRSEKAVKKAVSAAKKAVEDAHLTTKAARKAAVLAMVAQLEEYAASI